MLTLPAGLMRSTLFVAVLVLLVMAAVACSSDDESAPELDNPSQTGEELVNEFVLLVRNGDVEGLEDFLSDAFVLQRADGSTVTKDEYLADLPEVDEFTIDDIAAQQAAGTLVVSWTLTIESVVEGEQFAEEPAPRLSTFAWEDDRWRMTSHANFNVPET
jgi:Domain of unknown function (DUF4440)